MLPPRASRPTRADALRWTRITGPSSRTSLPSATLSAFPASAPSPWNKGASPPPMPSAFPSIPIARTILTAFTRFRKFPSSAKRRSSSRRKASPTKWASLFSGKSRAARFAEIRPSLDALHSMPAENIGDCIQQQIDAVSKGQKVHAIGLGFPGVIRAGIIEDSPNLHQVKGFNLQGALAARGLSAPVRVFNDADAMAAGIAATRDKLGKLIRVWTLGNGVGFGRYPWSEGGWEGGHSVVTLGPKG